MSGSRTVRSSPVQKADLFRLVALKYHGGVYSDDSELRIPRTDPPNAAAVVGRFDVRVHGV